MSAVTIRGWTQREEACRRDQLGGPGGEITGGTRGETGGETGEDQAGTHAGAKGEPGEEPAGGNRGGPGGRAMGGAKCKPNGSQAGIQWRAKRGDRGGSQGGSSEARRFLGEPGGRARSGDQEGGPGRGTRRGDQERGRGGRTMRWDQNCVGGRPSLPEVGCVYSHGVHPSVGMLFYTSYISRSHSVEFVSAFGFRPQVHILAVWLYEAFCS